MTYSHGSVVRLSLKNFMQYVEVEVFPGNYHFVSTKINFKIVGIVVTLQSVIGWKVTEVITPFMLNLLTCSFMLTHAAFR